MLLPSIFGERLFDDFIDFAPRGKVENQLMRTDVKDAGDHFELMMEMPGFKKEDVKGIGISGQMHGLVMLDEK